jgi:hypothetical protein
VRLESLCTISMRYVAGSWHRPHGSRSGDEEALGFGHGDGAVCGEIEGGADLGELSTTSPRRRVDANLRGRIAVRDGNELLLSLHGQSVQESAPGYRRAILARVELTTEAEPYRWLNTWSTGGSTSMSVLTSRSKVRLRSAPSYRRGSASAGGPMSLRRCWRRRRRKHGLRNVRYGRNLSVRKPRDVPCPVACDRLRDTASSW